MKSLFRISLLAIIGALSAMASTVTYDFTSGGTNVGASFGNVRTFTVNGITVTVTGWSLTGNGGTTFQTSQLGQFSTGLGTCNQVEGANCDSPDHQVDNVGSYDFVLFQFSTPLEMASITIDPFAPSDTDRDVSYWEGSASNPLNLTNKTVANLTGLGFGSIVNVSNSASLNAITVPLNGSTYVNSLLFGAQYGQGDLDDYFKISGLSATTAPEPASFVLMGAGLVGLGFIRKRIKS